MYPNPLKASIKNLNDNIVTVSTAFTRAHTMNFGARMSLFNYNDQIVVWSAVPYGEEVTKALKQLTGKQEDFNVTYLIVPDVEHTMAAKSFKEKYPELKIIAMEGVTLGGTKIDFKISDKYGNQLLDKDKLKEIGIKDDVILNNFEMCYLPNHVNKELVLFDMNSKYLFQADLLLNLGPKGTKLEQYSPATGYPENFNPHGGLSYLTRLTHPGSNFFKNTVNKMLKINQPQNKEGIKIIYNWDFTKMVPCHGNVVEDGKSMFKKYFDFL